MKKILLLSCFSVNMTLFGVKIDSLFLSENFLDDNCFKKYKAIIITKNKNLSISFPNKKGLNISVINDSDTIEIKKQMSKVKDVLLINFITEKKADILKGSYTVYHTSKRAYLSKVVKPAPQHL